MTRDAERHHRRRDRRTPLLIGIVALLPSLVVVLVVTTVPAETEALPEPLASPPSTSSAEDVEAVLGEGRAVVADEREAVDSVATREPSDVAPEDPGREERATPALLVRGSDVAISRVDWPWMMLRFPLLRPSEGHPRQLHVFGASVHHAPVLLESSYRKATDPGAWPLAIDLRALDELDQLVITTPRWMDEPARVVAHVTRATEGATITCPEGSADPCPVAVDTLVDPLGLLSRRWEALSPGASRIVDREDLGLIRLADPLPDAGR